MHANYRILHGTTQDPGSDPELFFDSLVSSRSFVSCRTGSGKISMSFAVLLNFCIPITAGVLVSYVLICTLHSNIPVSLFTMIELPLAIDLA